MFSIMSGHHLVFQARERLLEMAVFATSNKGKGVWFLVWKVHKQTEHACLKLVLEQYSFNRHVLELRVKSFTGLKTLVHIQTVTYGIKLSQDIL